VKRAVAGNLLGSTHMVGERNRSKQEGGTGEDGGERERERETAEPASQPEGGQQRARTGATSQAEERERATTSNGTRGRARRGGGPEGRRLPGRNTGPTEQATALEPQDKSTGRGRGHLLPACSWSRTPRHPPRPCESPSDAARPCR
jgi:hypothetical protein